MLLASSNLSPANSTTASDLFPISDHRSFPESDDSRVALRSIKRMCFMAQHIPGPTPLAPSEFERRVAILVGDDEAGYPSRIAAKTNVWLVRKVLDTHAQQDARAMQAIQAKDLFISAINRVGYSGPRSRISRPGHTHVFQQHVANELRTFVVDLPPPQRSLWPVCTLILDALSKFARFLLVFFFYTM